MKTIQRVALGVLALGVGLMTGCGARHSDKEVYYLVSANSALPYWQAAAAGFKAAAAQYKVTARVVGPEGYDQDGVLAAVGEGLFVQSVTGVHSGVNPISGDFSVGAEGLMIRDGKLAEPVREITVASTLQRILQSVVAIGADVEWLPGIAAGQTIAVGDMQIGGV